MFNDISKPLLLLEREIIAEWIDYNGHMNVSRYLELFSLASNVFVSELGADQGYVASGYSFYTVETHMLHYTEGKLGQGLAVTMQLLAYDEKRVHVFFWVHSQQDNRLLATGEQLFVHVDMKQGRACVIMPEILMKLKQILETHSKLECPKEVGRVIGKK